MEGRPKLTPGKPGFRSRAKTGKIKPELIAIPAVIGAVLTAGASVWLYSVTGGRGIS